MQKKEKEIPRVRKGKSRTKFKPNTARKKPGRPPKKKVPEQFKPQLEKLKKDKEEHFEVFLDECIRKKTVRGLKAKHKPEILFLAFNKKVYTDEGNAFFVAHVTQENARHFEEGLSEEEKKKKTWKTITWNEKDWEAFWLFFIQDYVKRRVVYEPMDLNDPKEQQNIQEIEIIDISSLFDVIYEEERIENLYEEERQTKTQNNATSQPEQCNIMDLNAPKAKTTPEKMLLMEHYTFSDEVEKMGSLVNFAKNIRAVMRSVFFRSRFYSYTRFCIRYDEKDEVQPDLSDNKLLIEKQSVLPFWACREEGLKSLAELRSSHNRLNIIYVHAHGGYAEVDVDGEKYNEWMLSSKKECKCEKCEKKDLKVSDIVKFLQDHKVHKKHKFLIIIGACATGETKGDEKRLKESLGENIMLCCLAALGQEYLREGPPDSVKLEIETKLLKYADLYEAVRKLEEWEMPTVKVRNEDGQLVDKERPYMRFLYDENEFQPPILSSIRSLLSSKSKGDH